MAGKKILVTGANRGIGLEVARELAALGHHVWLGVRDADAGRMAAAKIAAESGSVEVLPLDVADPASIAAAAREFAARAEHLDVLINNAGMLSKSDDSILSVGDDVVLPTLAVNALGPLRVAQAFVPFLKQSVAPRIVNVSSGAGQLNAALETWSPVYHISKTTLNAITRQLAAALPEFAVNSVCPGWVRTEMGGANADRAVEEGAATIVWLATEAPQTLTAQFLRDRQPLEW
jgi:NAD(P)-dependent dehydrogenase (short-subunit alcohol dehydrogenase family)